MSIRFSRFLRALALFSVCAWSGVFGQVGGLSASSPSLESLPAAQRAAAEALIQSKGLDAAAKPAMSVPQKSAPAKSEQLPIKGAFSSLSLRPFGENVFYGDAGRYLTPSDMPVPSDYVIGVGDTIEVRLFGKENRILQLRVERNGVVTLPEIGPLAVLGMTFEAMSNMVLERISKQKIGVEATVSMGALRSIQVFLSGEVNNAGAYTVDGLTTLTNALLVGGGVKPSGSMRKVEVIRQGRVVARVDLYDALLKGGGGSSMRLQSGDTIFVPLAGKRVAVSGDVPRPAIYELVAEKTVEDVLRLAGGMLPTAYPVRSKLDRIGRNGVRETLSLPTEEKRKTLVQDGDAVFVPSVLGRSERALTLAGHVPNPGTLEWKEGAHAGMFFSHPYDMQQGYYRTFAVIQRTDDKSGAKYFVPFNLYDVMHKGLNVPLQVDDALIVLNHDDIEFLSSQAVQNVLAGKLPPGVVAGAGSITRGAAALGSAEEAQVTRSQASSDLLNRATASSQGLESAGAVGQCKGLVELSEIVHQEGVDRYKAGVLGASVRTDVARLTRNQACTGIYDQYPGLLGFLLENAVTVRGEVKSPGVLPVAPGVTLDVALSARGGLTRTADVQGIEVLGADAGGASATRTAVVSTGQAKERLLQPGDSVLVRKKPGDQEAGLVFLGGEFKHPGSYTIRRGEKLSELIARAGGLTSFAYPYGSVFQRISVKEEKKLYYVKAARELQQSVLFGMTRQRAGGSTTDSSAAAAPFIKTVIDEMKSMDPTGRMVVEADPTVLQVRPELDVVLQPGDEVYVPRRPGHVNVMGEVLNPGAVQFQSGKLASDYIKAAGGTTRLADLDRVYAILPNGSAEPMKLSSWNFSPVLLPPGSTIYVAREAMPTTSMDLMLIITQMVKDAALAAASLYVISK